MVAPENGLSFVDGLIDDQEAFRAYVLDTNVLIARPNLMFCLGSADVLVPSIVVTELAGLRKKHGAVAQKALMALNNILELSCREGYCDDRKISLGDGKGTFQVVPWSGTPGLFADQQVIQTAIAANSVLNAAGVPVMGQKVALATNDKEMIILAASRGVVTRQFEPMPMDMTVGLVQSATTLNGGIPLLWNGDHEVEVYGDNTDENGCVLVADPCGDTCPMLKRRGRLVPLKLKERRVMGITPQNMEQEFFLNFLIDDTVDMVCCSGPAGSGKTLMSLAVGIQQMFRKAYENVMIIKANYEIGQGIGFLPGSKLEKLDDWIAPFKDNLDVIASNRKKGNFDWVELINEGRIEVEALTFMRGRSLTGRFVIIDEVQNIPASSMEMLVSRRGPGTKLVLIGDVTQIDNKSECSEDFNGLRFVMERMCGLPNVAVLNMTQIERSLLAKQAVERLRI